MLVIGITGAIASGKSTVSKYLSKKKYKIINSDKIAYNIVMFNSEVKKKIIDNFGEEILDDNKVIDRYKLGQIVFNNKNELQKLNDITHPYIYDEINKQILNNSRLENNILFVEIPLINQKYIHFDKVILIKTSRIDQINRLMKRNELSKKDALSRINTQNKYFENKYDFYINNDSIVNMENQINKILQNI